MVNIVRDCGTEDVEWIDEEYVDLSNHQVPDDDIINDSNEPLPIITIEKQLQCPWQDVDNRI